MNGTWKNWLYHAAGSLLLTAFAALVVSPITAAFITTTAFWAKEAGEKSKELDSWGLAPRRPFSDWNPLDSRWNWDSRFDLISGVLPAWVLTAFL